MRVRVVLALALSAGLGALALDMSASAPRTAGSNHISPVVFPATIPRAGRLCQPVVAPPADAARVQLLVGTFGRPVPALDLRFLDAAGAAVARGQLAAGGHEGVVSIAISGERARAAARQVCLRSEGSSPIVVGGEGGAANAGSAQVDGTAQPGLISLFYLRRGSESWWQLLPTLTRRFGLGKAFFFGEWTLPLVALLLLGVWIGAGRLLVRELS